MFCYSHLQKLLDIQIITIRANVILAFCTSMSPSFLAVLHLCPVIPISKEVGSLKLTLRRNNYF